MHILPTIHPKNLLLIKFCAQFPEFIRQYAPLKAHTIVTDLCDFEDLCEILLEWWPEERVPERAFHLLQHWLQLGLLS